MLQKIIIWFLIGFGCLSFVFAKSSHKNVSSLPVKTKEYNGTLAVVATHSTAIPSYLKNLTTQYYNNTVMVLNATTVVMMKVAGRNSPNITTVVKVSSSISSNTTVFPNKFNKTIEHYNSSTTNDSSIVCKEKHHKGKVKFHSNKSCYPPSAALRCFHDPIFCKKHFNSGGRNLIHERPTYGEYSSLKHQHWFHVIQHGGIAFLFHPCTAKKEIANLRQVASECLHRYVLAPYDKLTENKPLALVTWGCFYLSNKVNEFQMMTWIRKHAYSGPASHVHTNGKFKKNLVKKSKVLTDEKDAILCPNEEQLHSFSPTVSSTKKKTIFIRDPESIIHKRKMKLSKFKPDSDINISANITVTKVETGSAVWAAASLIFICGILVGWLLYTKAWSSGTQDDYKYEPLTNNRSFECEPGRSQFNLLKSSQQFMSTFRLKQHEKKDDSLSKVNLMLPITEDDEDEVIYQR